MALVVAGTGVETRDDTPWEDDVEEEATADAEDAAPPVGKFEGGRENGQNAQIALLMVDLDMSAAALDEVKGAVTVGAAVAERETELSEGGEEGGVETRSELDLNKWETTRGGKHTEPTLLRLKPVHGGHLGGLALGGEAQRTHRLEVREKKEREGRRELRVMKEESNVRRSARRLHRSGLDVIEHTFRERGTGAWGHRCSKAAAAGLAGANGVREGGRGERKKLPVGEEGAARAHATVAMPAHVRPLM
ncbi:hypothetical protein B0H17DRAFT_1132865 [Mycena rosella]|uniref:Uncharacterized protein n=1 Tax=Mycena rosella TaxID=1033263 RepID=A0AAD7GK66_MYCRO|nr:hypothetical protein B0H17DRAFT_1132865 [Mycena rosella]